MDHAPKTLPARRFAVFLGPSGAEKVVGRVGGAPAHAPQPVVLGDAPIGEAVCTRRVGSRCSSWEAGSTTRKAFGTTMKGAATGLARLVRGEHHNGGAPAEREVA